MEKMDYNRSSRPEDDDPSDAPAANEKTRFRASHPTGHQVEHQPDPDDPDRRAARGDDAAYRTGYAHAAAHALAHQLAWENSPDPKNREDTDAHVRSAWEDFRQAYGSEADEPSGISQFQFAVLYAHVNQDLADPEQRGPLGYASGPAQNAGEPLLQHAAISYQRLLATEIHREWPHTQEPGLDHAPTAIQAITGRLQGADNFLLAFHREADQLPNHEAIAWMNHPDDNMTLLQDMTRGFNDWHQVLQNADDQIADAFENHKGTHKHAANHGEPATLYSITNSAYHELQIDRRQLRELTAHHAAHPDPESQEETRQNILEVLTHMHHTKELHDHAVEQLEYSRTPEERDNSLRARAMEFLNGFRARFGLGKPDHDEAGGPAGGTESPALGYAAVHDPAGQPVTDLTTAAFARLRDAPGHQEQEQVAHMLQPLWEELKMPDRDDGDWRFAAYGSANPQLADPAGYGPDHLLQDHTFHYPNQNPDVLTLANELSSATYKTNIQMLYNEPGDVHQPGTRAENGLLTFNTIHRVLYSSDMYMDEFNRWAAENPQPPNAIGLSWTATAEHNEAAVAFRIEDPADIRPALAGSDMDAFYSRSLLEDRTDAAGLSAREDEAGTLYHAGVLTEYQLADHYAALEDLADSPDNHPGREALTDRLVHINYLHNLLDFTTAKMDRILEEEEEKAEQDRQAYESSLRGRLSRILRRPAPAA